MKKKEKGETSKNKERDFLDKVMKNLKKAVDAEDHNRSQAIEDLEFLNGDQWEQSEADRRRKRKRPMLTINMLPEKVDKVVGDMRQNRARVKLRPADSKADPEIARIREGMIRSIEYESRASAIYDYAGSRMVECGEGTWRVLTRYCEFNPFVQEIYLEIIKNSFMVFLDPKAKGHCKEDAKWGFILNKMPKDEFEDTYPNAKAPSDSMKFGKGLAQELWYTTESVVVAEYFEVRMVKKTLCLMSDGEVMEERDAKKLIEYWEKEWAQNQQQSAVAPPPIPPPPAVPGGLPATGAVPPPSAPSPAPGVPSAAPAPAPAAPMGNVVPMNPGVQVPPMAPQLKPNAPPKPEILKTRDTEVPQVFRYVLNACDILEDEKRIPGRYIPIVKITGKERNVEGKDYVRGLVRDAKDPQRLVNYWNTGAAEVIALAPKTPWVGTAKQFEGYEEDYANANIDNLPYLKYNPDKNAQGPPQRNRPADPPVAMFTQIQIAERNLDRISDVGPDLRNIAPDASAKSIIQRQKPSELSTFPFVDNLAQGQNHTYRIINEMIPEVYDTERDVRVRGEDEVETFVPINMSAEDALKALEAFPEKYKGMDAARLRNAITRKGKESRFNDIGTGRYEIVVDVGPSYATQRAETADKFTMLAQTFPNLWKVAGDLIVKSLDVQGSDEMAARLRKTLPPGLVKRRPGEQPDPPMPMPPQARLTMAKAQTEAMKQKKEMAKLQVELIKAKTEMLKQYQALRDTDKEMKAQILKVLSELHAPEHPADEFMGMRGEGTSPGMGGGQEG